MCFRATFRFLIVPPRSNCGPPKYPAPGVVRTGITLVACVVAVVFLQFISFWWTYCFFFLITCPVLHYSTLSLASTCLVIKIRRKTKKKKSTRRRTANPKKMKRRRTRTRTRTRIRIEEMKGCHVKVFKHLFFLQTYNLIYIN